MRRLDLALGIALLVFLAGVARDLQWHATHDTQAEFETASKQVEVHAILWLGALAMLIVSILALRRAGASSSVGYRITLISAVAYAAIAVWHFIEHANGNDPQVAHVFVYASQLGGDGGRRLDRAGPGDHAARTRRRGIAAARIALPVDRRSTSALASIPDGRWRCWGAVVA